MSTQRGQTDTRWSGISTSPSCKERNFLEGSYSLPGGRKQILGMTGASLVARVTILGFLWIGETQKGYAPVCLPESKRKEWSRLLSQNTTPYCLYSTDLMAAFPSFLPKAV